MARIAALIWLNQNTYARGTNHRKPSPLAGYGGILTVKS